MTEVIAHPSPGQALDPAAFIVRARGEVLGEFVERVLQGERFLALSGAPGTGKSVMARAIQDELASRSVTVIRIERGENDSIGSRSIICQLLHKPEAAFQPDDVETLFETLLDREDHAQRHAIIIEDAELLRPDALQYLRLVSSMVPKQMPPVVFVGRLSAWDEPGQPAGADARDLVTWRVELEPLSDDEAQAFIRQRLPATSARGRLDDAARDALVRSADGCIGRLAALLTAAADMLGPGDTAGAACTVTHPADGQDPTLTLDEPVPVAEHGAALTILPMSDIVLHPVAGPPLVEHLRNTPRWHAAVRHLTAAVLPLTVVGAIAYWQLTVHAGQLQGATNSAPTPTALSGVGNLSLASSSNAAIDDNVATERPVEALPSAADLLPGPSGPLPASIPAALPAPVFRTVSSDEADERPAPMAGLSVVPSDDRDAVWLVLDSAGADQLPGLASAPAEPPPQSPPIAQSAAGTEPAAPQVRTAAVPDEPSPDEPSKVPTATNTAAPLPTTENASPAAPVSADRGPSGQTGADDAADASSHERNAHTVSIDAAEPSNASTPRAERVPPPATDAVALPPEVPAIPQPVTDIAASPAVPATPSVSPLVATPTPTPVPASPEQETSSSPVLVPPAPVPPQQSATGALPPVAVPDEVPATSPQVPLAAAAPVAPPPAPAASVGTAAAPSGSPLVATPVPGSPEPETASSPVLGPPAPVPPQQSATSPLPPVAVPDDVPATSPKVPLAAAAPVAPPSTSTAAVGNSAALLPVPAPPKPPPVVAPVASAPHLDLGLLLSRGDAMLALGDISAARLFYERAAALGSAGAATSLGNTYDAAFLASIQAKGIVADQAAAIAWYRKAAALGDTNAQRQLKRLAPAQ